MKKYIFIIVVIFITSCVSQKVYIKDINGQYTTNTTGIDGEIVLNKNYEFLYSYNVGLIKTVSKGTWKILDNYLFLNSDLEYLNNTIDVTEIKSTEERFIKIVDNSGLNCIHAVIQFDDEKDFFKVDNQANLKIPLNKNFNSFTIHYLGESHKYFVKQKGMISFNIKLYLPDLSKTYFSNERFKLKNKTLINNEGLKFKINKSKG